MISRYQPDYILIAIVIIAIIVGTFQFVRNNQKLNSNKQAMPFIFGGILFFLLATIGNGLRENRWDFGYLISFFFLKRVSKDWFFRHLLSLGYIFLSWGITIFLIIKSKKNR